MIRPWLLVVLACSKHAQPPPPPSDAAPTTQRDAWVEAAHAPAIPKNANVVLITIDSLRADMPWTGYPRDIAPNLTKLAARAVSYTRAYAVSSYTSMSLSGFLAGRLPSELKRDGYFFSSFAPENLMFPEVLQSAGIHTLAGHAHAYFKDAGFDQGFDSYELVPNLKFNQLTDESVTSPDLEQIAERLLGGQSLRDRFFAWFHFLDPHDLYQSHEGIDWGRTPRDLYDGEVTFTDRSVGALVDFVDKQPWASRTVLVVTADHGEAFGEHGLFRHGFELWEPVIHVPLFFVIPGVAPRKIDTPRSALDLAPTILDMFSLAREPSFSGKSLVPELLGAPPEARDVAVDLPRTSDNDRRRALIHGTTKLISFGTIEYMQAFDLTADPDEKDPILSGPVLDDMRARLRAYERDVKEVPAVSCLAGCLFGTRPQDMPDAAAPTAVDASCVEGGAP